MTIEYIYSTLVALLLGLLLLSNIAIGVALVYPGATFRCEHERFVIDESFSCCDGLSIDGDFVYGRISFLAE